MSDQLSSAARAVLDAVRADARVQFIASLDCGRHLFSLPVALLETDHDLKAVRAKDPEDIALLRASMTKTGGEPIYTPCVFVRTSSGVPTYLIVDGHQRFKAAKESGLQTLTVQWVDRWLTIEDALADSLGMAYGRYEFQDDDIVSILATGKLTVKQVSDWCGKSEATVRRMEKISHHAWLHSIIKAGVLGFNAAGKLIDATDNNTQKLTALRNTLVARFDAAQQEANKWRDRIRLDKKRKYDTKSKAKADVRTYFKGVDWESWVAALESQDGIVHQTDGKPQLQIEDDAARKSAAPWVGDVKDWEQTMAVHNFFGKRHEEILTEDLAMILDAMPDITAKLKAIYRQRRHAEAVEANPIPSSNPVVTPTIPPAPITQSIDDIDIDDQDEAADDSRV